MAQREFETPLYDGAGAIVGTTFSVLSTDDLPALPPGPAGPTGPQGPPGSGMTFTTPGVLTSVFSDLTGYTVGVYQGAPVNEVVGTVNTDWQSSMGVVSNMQETVNELVRRFRESGAIQS